MNKFFLSMISLMFLAGCVTQDQADQKLAQGCKAGVEALLGSAELMTIKSTNFSNEEKADGLHRRVTLDAVEKDGWIELDKTYSCLFAQQWGLFKSSHMALLVQIKMPDRVVGKQDGKIIGDMQDFLNVTGKVDTAMGQH